jgi:hypothetical protein
VVVAYWTYYPGLEELRKATRDLRMAEIRELPEY